MSDEFVPLDEMGFVGGVLCLDLANTAAFDSDGKTSERLHDYADFLRWCRFSGEFDAAVLDRIAKRADSDAAREVFHHIVRVRDALYRIFGSVADRSEADKYDLDAVSDIYRHLLLRASLVAGSDGLHDWAWVGDPDDLEAPLWPIVRSAVDLLASPRLSRVRACCNDACRWLFLDSSRNRSRRWCDMRDCGNRAKARTYYRRSKKAAE